MQMQLVNQRKQEKKRREADDSSQPAVASLPLHHPPLPSRLHHPPLPSRLHHPPPSLLHHRLLHHLSHQHHLSHHLSHQHQQRQMKQQHRRYVSSLLPTSSRLLLQMMRGTSSPTHSYWILLGEPASSVAIDKLWRRRPMAGTQPSLQAALAVVTRGLSHHDKSQMQTSNNVT